MAHTKASFRLTPLLPLNPGPAPFPLAALPMAPALGEALSMASLSLTPASGDAAAAAAALPSPAVPPSPARPTVPVRVHARLAPACALPPPAVAAAVASWLGDCTVTYRDAEVDLAGAPAAVAAAVDRVAVVDTDVDAAAAQGATLMAWEVRGGGPRLGEGRKGRGEGGGVGRMIKSCILPFSLQVTLHVTAYVAHADDPTTALADPDAGDDDDDDAGAPPPYKETPLPARRLDTSMSALALPPAIKRTLLSRLDAGLALASVPGRGVDPALVGGGRVALLHGPPGTGKSTLCRAAAHRLAIDHGARFAGGAALLEVDATALFSKWLGSSARAVTRLFARVASLAVDEGALVCVVVDEVESLAGSRARGGADGAAASSDPGDAMRAVNALLTALDALAAVPGVVLFATSNLAGGLDAAFVDRADVVLRVPPPSTLARRAMLDASLRALLAAGVVAASGGAGEEAAVCASLDAAAAAGDGVVSGRALRRAPLAALAAVGWGRGGGGARGAVGVATYAAALRTVVEAGAREGGVAA